MSKLALGLSCLLAIALGSGVAAHAECRLNVDTLAQTDNVAIAIAIDHVKKKQIDTSSSSHTDGAILSEYLFGDINIDNNNKASKTVIDSLQGTMTDSAAHRLLYTSVDDNSRIAYTNCLLAASEPLTVMIDPEDHSNHAVKARWTAIGDKQPTRVILFFVDSTTNNVVGNAVANSGQPIIFNVNRPNGRELKLNVLAYNGTGFARILPPKLPARLKQIAQVGISLPVEITSRTVKGQGAGAPQDLVVSNSFGDAGTDSHPLKDEPISAPAGELIDAGQLRSLLQTKWVDQGGGYSCAGAPVWKLRPESGLTKVAYLSASVNGVYKTHCPARGHWAFTLPTVKAVTTYYIDGKPVN